MRKTRTRRHETSRPNPFPDSCRDQFTCPLLHLRVRWLQGSYLGLFGKCQKGPIGRRRLLHCVELAELCRRIAAEGVCGEPGAFLGLKSGPLDPEPRKAPNPMALVALVLPFNLSRGIYSLVALRFRGLGQCTDIRPEPQTPKPETLNHS